MRPRVLLLIVGICLAIVAWQTAEYPPTYLALSALWTACAGLCAGTCIAAAIVPSRALVATSGATLVCSAFGRALGLVGQIYTGGVDEQQLASFTIAAVVWSLVGLLAFTAWKHYVTPWSIARRWHRGSR